MYNAHTLTPNVVVYTISYTKGNPGKNFSFSSTGNEGILMSTASFSWAYGQKMPEYLYEFSRSNISCLTFYYLSTMAMVRAIIYTNEIY